MSKTILSIVIPNRNTKNLLRNCLGSIYQSESGESFFQIIVIDNGSKDGSVEMIKEEFPGVKLIVNKSNLGFAKAANQGWKVSKGTLVLFLNSDTVIKSKNNFKDIVSYMNKNSDVGCLSLKLKLRNGKLDSDTHRGFPTPWSSLCYFSGLEKIFPKSRIFSKYHQGWKDLNTVHEIDSGCGASMLIRKKVLEDLGGWDEKYFFYGEDLDLNYRIKNAGWKVMFYPFVEIVHFKGASSGLRKESKDIAKPDRETQIKSAEGSINAWARFYEKFYKGKYPGFITSIVIMGIRLKGLLRILKFRVSDSM